MNGKAHIRFSDGKPLRQVDKATYLDGEINREAERWSELKNRMTLALSTCNELETMVQDRLFI